MAKREKIRLKRIYSRWHARVKAIGAFGRVVAATGTFGRDTPRAFASPLLERKEDGQGHQAFGTDDPERAAHGRGWGDLHGVLRVRVSRKRRRSGRSARRELLGDLPRPDD